nr:MAG TPA: hypothetical protein [Caudoviricetes sp.]
MVLLQRQKTAFKTLYGYNIKIDGGTIPDA